MNSYEVFFRQGLGEIRFGSRSSQIARAAGAPDSLYADDGEIREFRRENGFQCVYSQQEELVEIGLSKNVVETSISGCKIFEVDPIRALTHVLGLGAAPYELYGFVVFMDLCITMTGFHDGAEDQKAITLFMPGRWDVMKTQLKPFKFPII